MTISRDYQYSLSWITRWMMNNSLAKTADTEEKKKNCKRIQYHILIMSVTQKLHISTETKKQAEHRRRQQSEHVFRMGFKHSCNSMWQYARYLIVSSAPFFFILTFFQCKIVDTSHNLLVNKWIPWSLHVN